MNPISFALLGVLFVLPAAMPRPSNYPWDGPDTADEMDFNQLPAFLNQLMGGVGNADNPGPEQYGGGMGGNMGGGNLAQMLLQFLTQASGGKGEDEESEKVDKDYPFWKWNPLHPCRIATKNGDSIYSSTCEDNHHCVMGPVETSMNNTDLDVFFCSFQTPFLLYHSCEVTNMNSKSLVKYQPCPQSYGQCTFGPLKFSAKGEEYEALFCSGMLEAWDKEKTIVDRACRVEDDDKYVTVQRRCPTGYDCTYGPVQIEEDRMKLKAYACEEGKNYPEKPEEPELPQNLTLQDVLGYLVYSCVERMATGDLEFSSVEKQLMVRMIQLIQSRGNNPDRLSEEEKYLLGVFMHLLKAQHTFKGGKEHVMEYLKSAMMALVQQKKKNHMLAYMLQHIMERAQEAHGEVKEKVGWLVQQLMKAMWANMMGRRESSEEEGMGQEMMMKMMKKMMKAKMGDSSEEEEWGGMKKMKKMMMKKMMMGGESSEEESREEEDGWAPGKILMMLFNKMMERGEGRGGRGKRSADEGNWMKKMMMKFWAKMKKQKMMGEKEKLMKKIMEMMEMGDEEENKMGIMKMMMKLMKMGGMDGDGMGRGSEEEEDSHEASGEMEEGKDAYLNMLRVLIYHMQSTSDDEEHKMKLGLLYNTLKRMVEGRQEEGSSEEKDGMDKKKMMAYVMKMLMGAMESGEGENMEKLMMFLKKMMMVGEGEGEMMKQMEMLMKMMKWGKGKEEGKGGRSGESEEEGEMEGDDRLMMFGMLLKLVMGGRGEEAHPHLKMLAGMTKHMIKGGDGEDAEKWNYLKGVTYHVLKDYMDDGEVEEPTQKMFETVFNHVLKSLKKDM